jgi:hypothetical protein
MSITEWSHGSGPEDFGWVINGESYTASELMNFSMEDLEGVLPKGVYAEFKKSGHGPDMIDVF